MVLRYYDRTATVLAAEATITGANQFTEPAEFDVERPFSLSIAGTFTATVSLQRSFDAGVTWRDVWQTTEPSEEVVDNVEPDVLWRIGCASGSFTSGTINVRISQ